MGRAAVGCHRCTARERTPETVWGPPVEARLRSTPAPGEMRHLLEILPRYLSNHVPPFKLKTVLENIQGRGHPLSGRLDQL